MISIQIYKKINNLKLINTVKYNFKFFSIISNKFNEIAVLNNLFYGPPLIHDQLIYKTSYI